ncbi:nitronate monooxygenase family protein [Plantactinospora sp. KBS50]|uniref:NAD(P)H-dependent flavin oxidoreductase n=1 Tax=Plantactinospora sp. KBS50 TaxID=2024580 RepID=UPI001E2E130F|nr:nitronate monooxygenase [Plantactinospora sp. KBS50]
MRAEISKLFDVELPVLAAPMAGGPGTPDLVTAVAAAGGLGFLAAGYQTPDALAAAIARVRGGGRPFGVNVFAPAPVPVDPVEFRRYARTIAPEGADYGLDLATAEPVQDDDHWAAKVDLLVRDPVPVLSFTFGLPDAATVAALRRSGTRVVQTVTSVPEARAAAEVGVDALVVQGAGAGAHYGTFTPAAAPPAPPLPELVGDVRGATGLPVLAAGGIAERSAVRAVLAAGAVGAMVGTALLRSPESGANQTHKDALADPRRGGTVVTRAFTGRPARALRNAFVDRYDGGAPLGYPALHHLTRPLRRAAAEAGDPERLHLWAGVGYRAARVAPVAEILRGLSTD